MFGSRLLDTSPVPPCTISGLLGVSGRLAVAHAHLRDMDGVGASDAGHGKYVSLTELAAQLQVSAQTIYDLRSKGRGPRGFRIGTQLRFRESEIDAWVQRVELADGQLDVHMPNGARITAEWKSARTTPCDEPQPGAFRCLFP